MDFVLTEFVLSLLLVNSYSYFNANMFTAIKVQVLICHILINAESKMLIKHLFTEERGQDYWVKDKSLHGCYWMENDLKRLTVEENNRLEIKCVGGCIKIKQVSASAGAFSIKPIFMSF